MKVLEQQKMEANVATVWAGHDRTPLDLPEEGGENEPPRNQEQEHGRPRTIEEMETSFE